jgi:hypothetical protein
MFSIELNSHKIILDGDEFWSGKIVLGDHEESFFSRAGNPIEDYRRIWLSAAVTLKSKSRAACFPLSINHGTPSDALCWVAHPSNNGAEFIEIMVRDGDFLKHYDEYIPLSSEMKSLFDNPPNDVSKWHVTDREIDQFIATSRFAS